LYRLSFVCSGHILSAFSAIKMMFRGERESGVRIGRFEFN
jgi:hypothetical protein